MAKKRRKKSRCGKGWTTLEIRRNGKTERVCARFIHPKGKRTAEWKKWLEVVATAAGGLA